MRRAAVVLALLGAGALAACGDDSSSTSRSSARDLETPPEQLAGAIVRNRRNGDVELTVGSKNFTEQRVLGELYAQGLEAAGYRVQRRLSLGNEKAAQKALQSGVVDGYPEYTGTALLSLCGVASTEIPKDPQQAYEDARDCLGDRSESAFPPTPFTSSNEVGVKASTARRYGLRTISDLSKVAGRFTLYGTQECRERMDCLAGLQKVYGLKFGTFTETPVDRRFDVLAKGGPVASIVFTTDPQIRREGITLLEDDQGMFPPNNSTFVARDEVVDKAGPDLGRTVQRIEQELTDEAMQELNARVDLDHQTPAKVARRYLREAGLVVGP